MMHGSLMNGHEYAFHLAALVLILQKGKSMKKARQKSSKHDDPKMLTQLSVRQKLIQLIPKLIRTPQAKLIDSINKDKDHSLGLVGLGSRNSQANNMSEKHSRAKMNRGQSTVIKQYFSLISIIFMIFNTVLLAIWSFVISSVQNEIQVRRGQRPVFAGAPLTHASYNLACPPKLKRRTACAQSTIVFMDSSTSKMASRFGHDTNPNDKHTCTQKSDLTNGKTIKQSFSKEKFLYTHIHL